VEARHRHLPPEAKLPAAYVTKNGSGAGPEHDFCLPSTYAAWSLLPEVRRSALGLLGEMGIPWHAEVDGGPSNHLLSSQVQCVNALGQMVSDRDRIRRAFGSLLDIDEVLEIEPERCHTFEYVGPTDFFDEAPGGKRMRGAHCTSVDAAFRHRAGDGATELVLLEWKYTECYRRRAPEPAKDAVRLRRYGAAVADPSGPGRGDVLPFELLLDEPIYQLVRQQLLAHALERAGAEGADRVRVVHVLPLGNDAYQNSLHRPEHLALGNTVEQVWEQLLRRSDRFTPVDSALFLDPDITSREYVLRYADDVVYDGATLMRAFDVSDTSGLEGALDFHGTVVLYDDAVDLVIGTRGVGLSYPFRAMDLRELADGLAEGDG